MPASTRNPPPKLLDEVRRVIRFHRYSIHTERTDGEWIIRFVRFHGMRSRDHLFPAEPMIESFLTDLAVKRNVAAATQNQAMHALVCLSTRVLHHAMEGRIDAVRADKKINVPVVMTREAVAAVLSLMDSTRPTGGHTALRERPAHHGSRPTQGQGHRCSDEATDRPFGSGRPGPSHHRSGHPDAGAPASPRWGQDAASAGCGSGAWRGVPAPCTGAEVAA